jgi:Ni,Fe-hydrogenase I large subunit
MKATSYVESVKAWETQENGRTNAYANNYYTAVNNKYFKAWYQKNKKSVNEKHYTYFLTDYYPKNKDKVDNYQREYQRKRYHENIEESRKYYRERDKKRYWSMTIEERKAYNKKNYQRKKLKKEIPT